jgi:hypothetical protein
VAALKEFQSVAKITQISATGHPLDRRPRYVFIIAIRASNSRQWPYQSKELGALRAKDHDRDLGGEGKLQGVQESSVNLSLPRSQPNARCFSAVARTLCSGFSVSAGHD